MHIGYSIDWKQIIVITWGGLRGAVGLALALVVAQTPEIPPRTIGSKVGTVMTTIITSKFTGGLPPVPCMLLKVNILSQSSSP